MNGLSYKLQSMLCLRSIDLRLVTEYAVILKKTCGYAKIPPNNFIFKELFKVPKERVIIWKI